MDWVLIILCERDCAGSVPSNGHVEDARISKEVHTIEGIHRAGWHCNEDVWSIGGTTGGC